MPRRSGFTLLELMVVVVIITLLTALLAAGMSRAIYQAELAVCASRLKATATGLVTYAMSHTRAYPYRQGVQDGDWEPHKLYQLVRPAGVYDERLAINNFIPLKMMLDPLCQNISIDKTDTEPTDLVFRNSHQWAGFKWFGHPGMQKIGDRLTWTDNVFYPQPRTFKFSLLAADRDFINFDPAVVDSSHPDYDGLLVSMKWQSEDVSGGFGLLADAALQATLSGWYRTGSSYRGPSDLNYGYDDGSVRRLDGVLYQDDPRMTRVPHFGNPAGVPTVGAWPTQFDNVPREN